MQTHRFPSSARPAPALARPTVWVATASWFSPSELMLDALSRWSEQRHLHVSRLPEEQWGQRGVTQPGTLVCRDAQGHTKVLGATTLQHVHRAMKISDDELGTLAEKVERSAHLWPLAVFADQPQAAVEATPTDQYTAALCLAAAVGATSVMQRMLAHRALNNAARKALVNTSDGGVESGNTPLHYAALCGHEGVAALLLQAGADATATNYVNTQPLHDAARAGHGHILRAMCNHDVDVTVPNAYGDTLLHRAAAFCSDARVREYQEVVDVCIAAYGRAHAGADVSSYVNYCNHKGFTALDVAQACGQTVLVKHLRDRYQAQHSQRWYQDRADPSTWTRDDLDHAAEWQAIRQKLLQKFKAA